jgi:hypothetical protein
MLVNVKVLRRGKERQRRGTDPGIVTKKLEPSTGLLYKVGPSNTAIAEAKKYSFFTALL